MTTKIASPHPPLPPQKVVQQQHQPTPPSSLQKVLHLFKHRHSFDQHDRQAETVRKVCKENPDGFFLRDLEDVTEVISIVTERIREGKTQFVEPLCMLLETCSLPFLKECTSDEFRHFRQICGVIKSIVHMLTLYASAEENVASYNHQILVGADMMDTLTEAIHLAIESPSKMQRLTNLCQKFTVAAELGQKIIDSGLLDILVALFRSCEFTNEMVSTVVEILWNIMEYVPNGAQLIATPSLFENIHHLLFSLANKGFRLQDKLLRNEVLVLCVLLLRVPENRLFACESNLTDLLVLLAVGIEMQDETALRFTLTNCGEDFEMKLCALNLLMVLSADPDSFRTIAATDFVAALFIHLDGNLSAHPSRSKMTRNQSVTIMKVALGCLCELVPHNGQQYLSVDGNRVLLELLTVESEESIRAGILHVLIAVGNIPQIQDELGEMGGLTLLLHLVSDTQNHPLHIRQSAVNAVAKVCENHPNNKAIFHSLSGVDILLSAAHTTVPAAGAAEPYILSVVDCIWSCVCGCVESENQFLEKQGGVALLNILEVCPNMMQSQVLSCLADLLLNSKTHHQLMQWRSRMTRRGVIQLLLDLWVANAPNPKPEDIDSGKFNDPQTESQPKNSVALVEDITKKNILTKIYAVLKHIDHTSVEASLTTEHKVALVHIKRFVEKERDILRDLICGELREEEIRPVTPDNRNTALCFQKAIESQLECVSAVKDLWGIQKELDAAEEAAFFNTVVEEHVARQTNSKRMKQPTKAPYVNRTKVIIPKVNQNDDLPKKVVEVDEQHEVDYMQECLEDTGIEIMLAATTARNDKRFQEQQEVAMAIAANVDPPKAHNEAMSETGSENERRGSIGSSGLERRRGSTASDRLSERDESAVLSGITPRGSGMDAARTLSKMRA